MFMDPTLKARQDIDPAETAEWLEALEAVMDREGPERAHFLLEALVEQARRSGAYLPYKATTAYLNTIPVQAQEPLPGDADIEWRIRSIVRWNAMAMVVRANHNYEGLGGHIASFASAATLYDVGFNHFFHAPSEQHGGDLVMIQGHSSPGIYARAFLEGRLSEEELLRFRREARPGGLSSYPHPWLMPGFWQYPTVSMGLGPLMAIFQARFMKYLHDRGLVDTEGRKVWAFMGDGEMDEPESLGSISLASRENLDNLIFVVNCNLQRLDGPVRGNGKIIQELEAVFRGAGWNVIKLVWGSYWDPLLARDRHGLLRQRMEEAVDGEYQAYKASQDGQGLRHGRGRRGDEHHPPAEEDGAAGADGLPRPPRHPGFGRGTGGDSVLPAAGRQPRDPLPEGATRGPGRIPAGADRCRDTARRAGPGRLRRPAAVEPRAPVLDHDGVRAPVHAAHAESRDPQPAGAHRRGRGAYVRHGGHVPPTRHLRAHRPALRTGRRAQDRALQGGP